MNLTHTRREGNAEAQGGKGAKGRGRVMQRRKGERLGGEMA